MDYCKQFFFALSTQTTPLVKALLDDNPELANMRSERGICGLHLAAQLGDMESAELLLSRGADLEAVCRSVGSTPLKYAVFFAHIPMVRFLLSKGADVNNKGSTSRTPLDLAVDATNSTFREMGTPGSDVDYARIANLLRSKSVRA